MNIPEIKIVDNKFVSDILEVPIMINGEKKFVKMNKITSGKRREVIKKYVKTGVSNQKMNAEVTDPLGIPIGILSEVIFEAPFDTTENGLGKLPEEVVDYLYSQYEDWSKKKLNSDA
jgi:hypothetical protein